jgi:TonB-linked SusC/RagA family outer membrane protein
MLSSVLDKQASPQLWGDRSMSTPQHRRSVSGTSVLVLTLFLPIALHAQQVGTITGRVTSASGEPVSGAHLTVQGTRTEAVARTDGGYNLVGIPVGRHVVIVDRIGFQNLRQEGVTVTAGQVSTLDLVMQPTALTLQEIVVTGLVDPLQGMRSPISVARVPKDLMPVVAAGNAVQNLQGLVSGVTMNRGSGQPGSEPSIMLRTPTSLRGSGAPMIVVDGVILGGILSDANTTAIDGMDIESIEVIRGAAAASLYGSRAAAGVISITTARGKALDVGTTRFSATSEYGAQQAVGLFDLPTHHHYLVTPDGTSYANALGQPVARAQRFTPSNVNQQFMDKPYPGPVFDNLTTILRPGNYQSYNVAVQQNTSSTNFSVSLNRREEQGAVEGNDGFELTTFRVNLDHRFEDALTLTVSTFYSRDRLDNLSPAGFFTDVLNAPRDVDLSVRGPDGSFLQQPNPDVIYQNPLWTQATRENERKGTRSMASGGLRWNASSWLTLNGLVSYDRREDLTRSYVPKGTPLSVGQEGTDDGSISFNSVWTDTWNAEAQAQLRRTFGALDARLTARTVLEKDRTELGNRSGSNFILPGVPQLSNVRPENRNATSSERDVRAFGYLADLALDYDKKYILSLLGRRDGSSLFGPDNRWHGYYRVAGSWMLSEESWFDVGGVQDLKLAYSRGTAGGRPSWDLQYETWSQVGGVPTKDQLGNRSLAPERTTEQEVTMAMTLANRFGLELTHAWQRTEDQLVPAPLPPYIGYTSQWVNAGTVSGRTTELTLEARMIQRRNFSWTSMLVGDYANGRIEDWPLPCDATRTWRFDCTGEPVYGIYGFRLMTSLSDLERHRGGDALPFAGEFQLNDEGYLVWVGDKSWDQGLVNGVVQPGTWGTTSPTIGGRTYGWGLPIFEEDATGQTLRPSLGEGAAVNLGLINTVQIGGLNLHAHFHASLGGVANNRAFQDLMTSSSRNAPMLDQFGKADGNKKPIGYYLAAVGSGGSNYITESANYLKLRTASVSYTLNAGQIARLGLAGVGVESLELGVVGRNLFFLTGFSGFDPEQALNLNSRQNANGTGTYPSTRTLTAQVSVTF